MRKEIIVSAVSALITALVLYFIATTFGLLKKELTDEQMESIIQELVDEASFRENIITDVITEINEQGIIEKLLDPKLNSIRGEIDELKHASTILAVVRIDGGKITLKTEGVQYNSSDGIVTFPNPSNLKFVPIISDFLALHYMTEKHYVREIYEGSSFKVWNTTLDTGGRGRAPDSFLAIVIGFE